MDGSEKKEVFETKLEYDTMAQSGVQMRNVGLETSAFGSFQFHSQLLHFFSFTV